MTNRHRSFGMVAAAVVFGLVSAARPARSDSTFPQLVEQWSVLTLAGPPHPVEGLRLSAGHLTLTLARGDAILVLAGDQVVGLFFRGQGTLEHLSADPIEAPVVSYNVKKNTGLTLAPEGKTLRIRGSFEEVLWLTEAGALPALPPAISPATPGEAFARHVKRFGRIHASPAAHQFVAWRLNTPDRPFVRAEIAGGGDDLVYIFDGADAKSETLLSVSKRRLRDTALEDRLDLAGPFRPAGRPRPEGHSPSAIRRDGRRPRGHGVGPEGRLDFRHGDDPRAGRTDERNRHGPLGHPVRRHKPRRPRAKTPATQGSLRRIRRLAAVPTAGETRLPSGC